MSGWVGGGEGWVEEVVSKCWDGRVVSKLWDGWMVSWWVVMMVTLKG